MIRGGEGPELEGTDGEEGDGEGEGEGNRDVLSIVFEGEDGEGGNCSSLEYLESATSGARPSGISAYALEVGQSGGDEARCDQIDG